MNHNICDDCEAVSWCANNGCIPLVVEEPVTTQPEKQGLPWAYWLALVLSSAVSLAWLIVKYH